MGGERVARVAVWAVVTALACSGDVGTGSNPGNPSDDSGQPSGPGAPGNVPDNGNDQEPGGTDPIRSPEDGDFVGEASETPCAPGEAEPATRLVRLTHTQYNRTIFDLLGLDTEPANAFLTDATFAGFDNSAEGLIVPDRLARDYRRAAEELAATAVADVDARNLLINCTTSDADCARQTIESLGRRAFRRPLTQMETAAYLDLHAQGDALIGSGSPFDDGLQLVLEAMLQSPKFLYRVELSQDTNAEGFVLLNGFEVATRLSYMLWNTMPDDELLDAAETGQLGSPDGVAIQADRMLKSQKARQVLDDFARQWLDFARFEDLSKDPNQFPDWSSTISDSMAEEVRLYLREIVFERQDPFAQLYTSSFTYVDDALAPYYGLPTTGRDGFERVELDPAERAGLLTQLGFLTSHAFPDRSSPIHRGVFVHRRILCSNLPDPPGDVDFNLPPIEGDIKTTRQQVEVHTSPAACNGCHGIINPAGYAFEHYDAAGQHRTTDHGEPVDASASLTIDGESASFDGALEFSQRIAESQAARHCFATQYLRYAYGRRENGGDSCTLDYLADQLGEEGYAVKDMIMDLTQTRAFLLRKAEVTP